MTIEDEAQRRQFVETVRRAEPCIRDGEWIILNESVERVLVMLFDADEDKTRPCALARVFKPEANTTPPTNTIADVADYEENPDNMHKIADIKGVRRDRCFFHAMAVCGGRLRPITCDEPVGPVRFHLHKRTTVDKDLLADSYEGLKELDPATPNG